nr:hypothetical protein [Tanacetum cinerariifolium]
MGSGVLAGDWQKKEKKGVLCLGRRYCAMHSISKSNPQHALKDKVFIDSGCSRHMTGNTSYLFDFEELNGGYVAFGGNPKGGKISGKDDNQVLLRVPRENNMYNVDVKNIVPSGALTCLFAKATLDESNLWHRRLGHINFKTMNKLVKVVTDDYGRFTLVFFLATKEETSPILKTFIMVLENQLSLIVEIIRNENGTKFKNNDLNHFCRMKGIKREFSVPRTSQKNGIAKRKNRTLFEVARTILADLLLPIPFWAENTNGNTTFDEKGPEFEAWKPESEVNVSLSSSAHNKKHDDKTKREAKGKSHVELIIRYRNLSADTNTFSAAGPSNAVVRPTHGKSSYVDYFQLFDDPNMPELEDITYSDDEEDVGVQADFNNLETSITVSPIPTTRVHKDHPVTQIIGDLSLATQIRSMTRVAKDQARFSQINNDVHTCMFACFLSQEEPKRVHQALKDPCWIEAMQEELLQFKIQKVWVLVDLPHRKRAIGHTQDEGIDYEEVFAPVDTDHPDKVYKVFKALYGLHQAPRAWYETLANYLLENGFQRGKIDQILFIKRQQGDILLVHIYVDDIIFGLTNKELCKAFEKTMKDKFQMSSMGELTFFLNGKSASTPIDTKKPLLKDPDGEDVDVHTYRSIIGSLMYLTSSIPDIMLAVYACAHFQVTPKVNDVTRLQALVDKKKVVVTEVTIRDALRLDDAKGIECIPNDEIFAELARIGYEKPSTKLTFFKAFFSSQWKFLIHTILQCMSAKRMSWNEFSSSMASDVICLSTGDADEVHVENVNAAGVAEGAASVADDEVNAVVDEPSIPSPTQPIPPPQPSQDIPPTSQEEESEPTELQEVVDVVTTTKIITKVVTVASDTITAVSTTITTANALIPAAITTATHSRLTAAPRRRK